MPAKTYITFFAVLHAVFSEIFQKHSVAAPAFGCGILNHSLDAVRITFFSLLVYALWYDQSVCFFPFLGEADIRCLLTRYIVNDVLS